MKDTVEIYTDGACEGNPGPGGWSALLRHGSSEKTISGSHPHTTNNRMELTAVIEALRALKRPCRVAVHTDSQYVQKGITEWLPSWKARGWRTSSGAPVQNLDLWLALEEAASRHEVVWRWVKAHSGHPENNRVDALAKSAMKKQQGATDED